MRSNQPGKDLEVGNLFNGGRIFQMTRVTLFILIIFAILLSGSRFPQAVSIFPDESSLMQTIGLKFGSNTTAFPAAVSPAKPTPAQPDSIPGPFYASEIIGYSVEGNAMWVYQFGDGPSEVMMVAGVHGGYEWNTVALMDQIIARLKRYPALIPADKTLYILRVFNVDGYVRDKGDDGRLNSNGVDLNRNWKANWKDSWEGTECWSRRVVSAGTGPFSEPESQALRDFILAHDIQALINYHSAALGIFAGGPDDLESIRFAQTLAEAGNYRFPPYETDCEFTGQFVDWASRQGIAAVDLELTTHSRTDFAVNLIVLQELLKWGTQD